MSRYLEKTLIFLAKNGSEDALTYIYKKYVKEIHYYFFSRIKNKEDANDLTSEVFIAFIDALETFRGDASIRTYIYVIAKNKLFDHYKEAGKTIYDSEYIENLPETNTTESKEEKDLGILDGLNSKEKEVVESKYFMNEKHKDISKRLGISIENSRQTLKRALSKIKQSYGNRK
jgi:RNA polymerase sigma-70 factor (ECF subfamily)